MHNVYENTHMNTHADTHPSPMLIVWKTEICEEEVYPTHGKNRGM